jgi:hypothetical protein
MVMTKSAMFILFAVYALVGVYLLNQAFSFLTFINALPDAVHQIIFVIGAALLFWSAFKYLQWILMPGYGYGGYY